MRTLQKRIVELLQKLEPDKDTMYVTSMTIASNLRENDSVVRDALRDLVDKGDVRKSGSQYSLPQKKVEVNEEEARVMALQFGGAGETKSDQYLLGVES